MTDLDVVVPKSVAVFKSGGDLAYHHGGASLQELVIPVITVRMKTATGAVEKKAVAVKFAADAVTNRVFVVEMELGASAGGFFAEYRKVRPIAVVGSRQVAATKMTAAGPVEGGEVLLEPGKSVTAVLMLTDDTI